MNNKDGFLKHPTINPKVLSQNFNKKMPYGLRSTLSSQKFLL